MSRSSVSSSHPLEAARRSVALDERIAAAVRWEWFLWLLVVIGVVVRVRQYVGNRSLWLDEAFLSLNIIERSLHRLLDVPLDFDQAGPAGFLVVEKLATHLFGKGEYALRAFPFVCGILSVLLFALVARRLLQPLGVLVAVALFALAGPLVYFATEVKPYSGDVAALLALLLIGQIALDGRMSFARGLAFGALGFIVMQFTYAGVLAGAGIGAALVALLVLDRKVRPGPILALVGVWAIGAIVFLATYVSSDRAYYSRGGAFAPFPSSVDDVKWYFRRLTYVATDANLYRTLSDPLVVVTVVAVLLAAVGVVSLAVRNGRLLGLLLAPVAVMVVASAAHRYPLLARTMVFIVPIAFLLIAEGAVAVTRRLPAAARVVVLAVVVGALFTQTAFAGPYDPVRLVERSEMKGTLEYVADHWRKGDVLYVHYASQYAFAYYLECGCLSFGGGRDPRSLWPARRIVIRDPTKQFPAALEPLNRNLIVGVPPSRPLLEYGRAAARIAQHSRGWVLMTFSASDEERAQISQGLLKPLSHRGERVLSRLHRGTRLYLYDFSRG